MKYEDIVKDYEDIVKELDAIIEINNVHYGEQKVAISIPKDKYKQKELFEMINFLHDKYNMDVAMTRTNNSYFIELIRR